MRTDLASLKQMPRTKRVKIKRQILVNLDSATLTSAIDLPDKFYYLAASRLTFSWLKVVRA